MVPAPEATPPSGATTMGPPTATNGTAEGGRGGGHQKMKSIDVQKPLINPWVAANH